MKIQLLIAANDDRYARFLSEVLEEEYLDVFEIVNCLSNCRIEDVLKGKRFDAALIAPELVRSDLKNTIHLPLLLWDSGNSAPCAFPLQRLRKYQRISGIVQELLEKYSEVIKPVDGDDTRRGRVNFFWSPAGGSGTTTVALAYAMQQAASGKQVLYLNLENFSSSEMYFEETGKSISTVFEKIDGNIDALIRGIRLQDKKTGVYYFTPPENLDDVNVLETEDILKLINACARGMDEVIVDSFSGCDMRVRELMLHSDCIYLVYSNMPSSIWKMQLFTSRHNIYERLHGRICFVANYGAQRNLFEGERVVSLPALQSASPIDIARALSKYNFTE